MDSRELAEWQAWEEIHGPLGAERMDYLIAGMRQTMAEIHRDTDKRARPFRTTDFMVFAIPGAASSGSGGGTISSPEAFFQWATAMKARQAQHNG